MKDNEIFLIRHLKTTFNENGCIMGRVIDADIKSDENNLDNFKARVVSINIKYGPFPKDTLIITSPLKRCRQTAALLKDQLKLKNEVEIMDELNETDMGKFSGKDAGELRQEFGDILDEWMFKPESFKFPEGESYEQVHQRIILVLENLKERLIKGQKSIIICTHVDIIKMILSEIMGFSFNKRRDFSIPNGSATVLKISKDGKYSVEGFNVYP